MNKAKKVIKTVGIVLAVILCVCLIAGFCVYKFILQYPEVSNNLKVGKWYRVSDESMISADGSEYHALFKKGTENKVMVYFAGGGVSVNEDTAKNDTYSPYLVKPDIMANLTMNMGGIATDSLDKILKQWKNKDALDEEFAHDIMDRNPFADWTVILFPYATGDFHIGTGEFEYTSKDGKQKILHHNGYTNFTSAMDKVIALSGIDEPDAVIVTGYSAGGWGASLLAQDVFENYFPNASSKTVLVDSALGLNDKWYDIAVNVWEAPKHIVERVKTDNIVLDSLIALHDKFGDDVNILFDCSVRDGDLSKVQAYFQNGIMDTETGEMPLSEEDADFFQQTLKQFITDGKAQADMHFYIFDGMSWYGDERNFTAHTIIQTPYVFADINGNRCSVAAWLLNAVNGDFEDYGIELVDNRY